MEDEMTDRVKRTAIGVAILTIAHCLLPIDSPAADAGLKKLRFVQSGLTSSSWPVFVA